MMKYTVPTILFFCLIAGTSYAMKDAAKEQQTEVTRDRHFFCRYCGTHFSNYIDRRAHEAHCSKDPSKPRK